MDTIHSGYNTGTSNLAMNRFGSLGEQLIEICWKRTSSSQDHICMYQVVDLIREMQMFLSVTSLLSPEEMKLLTQMSEKSPSSKLHRREMGNFLNKLVQTSNWEGFLHERAGISPSALKIMIENAGDTQVGRFGASQKAKAFRKPLSPYSIHKRNSIARNEDRNDAGKKEVRKNDTTSNKDASRDMPPFTRNRPTLSPSVSPPRFGLSSRSGPNIYDDTEPALFKNTNTIDLTSSISSSNRELNELRRLVRSKEQHIQEIERQYSIVSNENIELTSETKRQRAKITDLENSRANLNKYIEALESQLENKRFNPIADQSSQSERALIKELIDKNSQQDITIRELNSINDHYQDDLKSLAIQDETNQKLMSELKNNITRQDGLISDLQLKLDLQSKPTTAFKSKSSPNSLQQFMKNLPFVKQYYMFYKYQQDHKNLGVIFINMMTLLFTAIIILNLLKFVFYISVTFGTIGTRRDQSLLDYEWEEDGPSPWLSTYVETEGIGLAGWKQIPWLEYWVYRINDWLYE